MFLVLMDSAGGRYIINAIGIYSYVINGHLKSRLLPDMWVSAVS